MLRAIFAALFTLTVCALAQGNTAISALRLLPNEARKNLARIEGRDGAPWPERWYFLVYDASQPLGLREYAVAEGELKANRTISQFADEIKPADVIGNFAIKFDSDAVAALAARFCVANGARLGSVDYELGKHGAAGATAWRATVLSGKGDQLGVLVIDAQKGSVERHDGFDNKPVEVADIEEKPTPPVAAVVTPKSPTPKITAKPAEKPAVASTTTKPATSPTTAKPTVAATTKKPSSPESLLQKPFLATKPAAKPPTTPKVATPEKPKPPVAAAEPTPKPNALKRFGNTVGGGVKKLFGN